MAGFLSPEHADSLPDIPEPAEAVVLAGHDGIAGELAGAYQAGRLHHAVLLAGPKGIGKATFAFRLAHHLLRHPDAGRAPLHLSDPDILTPMGRQIASGAHPSLLHISRPWDDKTKKFKTAITVEEVRRVGRFLSMRSHDDSYRIVVVDSADDMNRNAANALLKSLEEPPPRALFILISHQPGQLLPTIRSRCQVHRFSPLGRGDMISALEAIGASSASRADDVVAAAEGSPRKAILLTEYGGLEIARAIDRLLAAERPDPVEVYKVADAVAGRDQEIQFGLLNQHLLGRIADAASNAAAGAQAREAQRLAALFEETVASINATTTYNLDRRQHVVGLIERIGGGLGPNPPG